jgi:hypothetical protein
MGIVIIAFLFLGLLSPVSAVDFSEAVRQAEERFLEMLAAQSDEAKLGASEALAVALEDAFVHPESFVYPFSELKNVGFVNSPDKAIRIVNWNVPLNDETHHYEGFVLLAPDKKTGKMRWERLRVSDRNITKPESKYLSADQWVGALYYEIVPVRQGKHTLYTLIGWQGYNKMITRKVIDVLDVSGRNIRFGAPIFKMDKSSPKRLIFEYNREVQMSIRYKEKERMIIYDHLSPIQPGLEGNPAFYGPDLSFDALVWEKDKWVHKSNVDARQEKDPVKRPYNDPRRR